MPKLQIEEIRRRVPLRVTSKPAKRLPRRTLGGITEEEEEEDEVLREEVSVAKKNLPLILNTSEAPEQRFRVLSFVEIKFFRCFADIVETH